MSDSIPSKTGVDLYDQYGDLCRDTNGDPVFVKLRDFEQQVKRGDILNAELSGFMKAATKREADQSAEIERLTKILLTDDAAIEEVQAENQRLRAALTEVRAERNYLRGSLETIASGSLDDMPPFRAAPHDVLRKFAQKALDWPRATDETTAPRRYKPDEIGRCLNVGCGFTADLHRCPDSK